MSPALVPSQKAVVGNLAMGSTTVRRPCRVSVQPPSGGASGSVVATGCGVCSTAPESKGALLSHHRLDADALHAGRLAAAEDARVAGDQLERPVGLPGGVLVHGHRVLDGGGAERERLAVHQVGDDQRVLQRGDLEARVADGEAVDALDHHGVAGRGGGELAVEAVDAAAVDAADQAPERDTGVGEVVGGVVGRLVVVDDGGLDLRVGLPGRELVARHGLLGLDAAQLQEPAVGHAGVGGHDARSGGRLDADALHAGGLAAAEDARVAGDQLERPVGLPGGVLVHGHRVLDGGGAERERLAVHQVGDDQRVLQRGDLEARVADREAVDALDHHGVAGRGGGELAVEAVDAAAVDATDQAPEGDTGVGEVVGGVVGRLVVVDDGGLDLRVGLPGRELVARHGLLGLDAAQLQEPAVGHAGVGGTSGERRRGEHQQHRGRTGRDNGRSLLHPLSSPRGPVRAAPRRGERA